MEVSLMWDKKKPKLERCHDLLVDSTPLTVKQSEIIPFHSDGIRTRDLMRMCLPVSLDLFQLNKNEMSSSIQAVFFLTTFGSVGSRQAQKCFQTRSLFDWRLEMLPTIHTALPSTNETVDRD